MLVELHLMAAMTIAPELAIERMEADQLADAGGRMLRHYNVPKVALKTMDTLRFLYVAGMIYGTRGFAIMERKKTEFAAKKPQRPAAPVQPGAPPVVQPVNSAATVAVKPNGKAPFERPPLTPLDTISSVDKLGADTRNWTPN